MKRKSIVCPHNSR